MPRPTTFEHRHSQSRPTNIDAHGEDEQDETLDSTLDRARQDELERLRQTIFTQQPHRDTTAQFMLSQLNLPVDAPTDADEQPQASVQPLIQSGVVAHHHRPHAAYGHLDRTTIARECRFNLKRPSAEIDEAETTTTTHKRMRLHTRSFAITAWTDASKERVLEHIKHEFGIDHIQYICIGEERSELNHRRHLHIQIILKEKVDRRRPFLDDITQTRCNYQVTRNDLAWNEYIKKEGNFLEFNEFRSTRARGEKQWPSSSSSSSATSVMSPSIPSHTTDQQPLVPIVSRASSTSSASTVRGQIEARRQHEHQTVVKALKLAETQVHQAMDLIRHALPTKFLAHSSWYLSTFNYVHLRAQDQATRTGQIDKEYVWPLSFPHCTDRLRQAMNRWIRHHFSRTKRAKCLILIGPTGTGKTSFALSLPGRVNYFKERWNLDQWSDYARYSVYDDIPWDDFAKLNYPNKKGLLTQNGRMNATDKYRGTREIHVRQPAIVLLNPEDAGSLLAEPVTVQEQQTAMYWKARAFIYIMQEDEYFYQRPVPPRPPPHQPVTTTDERLSGASSMNDNEARLGDMDEFEQMLHRYQQKHHPQP